MKTAIKGILFALALSSCGGSGGGSSEQNSAKVVEKSADSSFSSVEVGGQLPNNGTRPVESLCTPGSFVRVSTNSDKCGAERFDVFTDNGFYAERGFTDKEYYFFEPLTESYEAPSYASNILSLMNVEIDGHDDALCTFFCSADNQTMSVMCIGTGEIICGETFYSRVADAPLNPATDPSTLPTTANSTANCSNASGSYTLHHVTCDPGLTLSAEQLGGPVVIDVSSTDDLINASTGLQSFLPGVQSEGHFECSLDGNEVHVIGTGTGYGMTVTCDEVFLR